MLEGYHAFTTTVEKMKVFLALLLISGYSNVLRHKMFWSNGDAVRNDAALMAIETDLITLCSIYM